MVPNTSVNPLNVPTSTPRKVVMSLATAPRRPAGHAVERTRAGTRPAQPPPAIHWEVQPPPSGDRDEARAALLVHVAGADRLCVGCLDVGRLACAPCCVARSAALVLGIDVTGSR